jgi:hypothetical protein
MNTDILALQNFLAGLTDKSLRLTYNGHKSNYCDVKTELSHNALFYVNCEWVPGEREKAIEMNTLWEIHLDRKKEHEFKKYAASTSAALVTYVSNDSAVATGMTSLDGLLKELLNGKFSHALITYNTQMDNYTSLQQAVDEEDEWLLKTEWASEAEYNKGLETNTLWTLQWYPDTPVGFCLIHAATLDGLFNYFKEE